MEIFAGLIMGLVGSMHCIGMCGPIAIAVPPRNENRLSAVMDGLIYNLGRSVTYVVLGLGIGLLGSTVSFAGYQEYLSIVSGVMLLIIVFTPKRIENLIGDISLVKRISDSIKRGFKVVIGKRTLSSLFGLGLLNGLLPCGLVYVALTASLAAGSVLGSGLFMLMFGLGTLPVMAAIFIMKSMITFEIRRKINKFIPVGIAVVAVLLILRGLSLGIPYVSPELPDSVQQKIEQELDADSCH